MQPLDPMTLPIGTVSSVTRYIKRVISRDKWLRELGVRGEVSGFSPQPNGIVYFKLKEKEEILECVVWRNEARRLPALENGSAVVAFGRIEAYEKRSQYQLIVNTVILEGLGDLHLEFERLKKKLDGEGAFNVGRKRPLPRYPFRVALVSSREGRGATDFLSEAEKRGPHVEIVLVDTPVQGSGAAIEIADAIDRASRLDVDVIVVARGGGSFEDLFPFSTETVARAILRARHPVVSAIGHEKDVSIADLVADVRAPVPGLAASLVIPNRADILKTIARNERTVELSAARHLRDAQRDLDGALRYSALVDPARILGPRERSIAEATTGLGRHVRDLLRSRADEIAALAKRLLPFDPSRRLSRREHDLGILRYRLDRAAAGKVDHGKARLESLRQGLDPATERGFAARTLRVQFLEAKLDARNPERILQSGYAIVRHDGNLVRDVRTVPVGARISAQVARGTLVARVEEQQDAGEQG